LEKDNFAGKSTITKENVRLCTIIVEKNEGNVMQSKN
jgi:hypothetical protein